MLQDPEVKRQMQWDRKTFNNKWHEKDSFWKEINAQIPNLRQVYFAGGEPLMIKEHKMFIKEIILRYLNHQVKHCGNRYMISHIKMVVVSNV